MEIKHIQNDSLGYTVTNHIARLGHISSAASLYETMLRFFTMNQKEVKEDISNNIWDASITLQSKSPGDEAQGTFDPYGIGSKVLKVIDDHVVLLHYEPKGGNIRKGQPVILLYFLHEDMAQ